MTVSETLILGEIKNRNNEKEVLEDLETWNLR